MKHTTGWEDAQMAEVYCDGHWTGAVIHADEGEPFVCDRCGTVLRLVWDVRLEERSPEDNPIPRSFRWGDSGLTAEDAK